MVNKGMRKECTRVPLVGLASQFYPTPFVFFLEGKPHTIVWPTLWAGSHAPKLLPLYIPVYAKYTTGSAFEIMASHDTTYTYSNCDVISLMR